MTVYITIRSTPPLLLGPFQPMDLISHVKQEILANEGRPSVFFDNADVLKEGIRAVDQNLRFGGQELLYGQTLEYYNIQNLSFLDLDIRIILHLQFRSRSEILRDVNLNQTGGQIKTMVAALGRHAQGPGYHEFRLLLNANQLNYKTQTTLGAMGASDRSVLILREVLVGGGKPIRNLNESTCKLDR